MIRYARLSVACVGLFSSAAALPARSPSEITQAPPGILIDKRVRDEVLNSLAQALESRYVLPDVGKKLADAVRAKQKAHAYENVLTAPELARVLTDHLLSVAHDKHLRVTFSRIRARAAPAGSLSPQMLDELRRENG